MLYALLAGVSFALASCITPWVQRFAKAHHIMDAPDVAGRKMHHAPTPLLGGLSIFIAFFAVMAVVWLFTSLLSPYGGSPEGRQGGVITGTTLGVLFGASCILILGGFLDDKYILSPWQQIIAPVLAAGLVALSGIQIDALTNPWGGVITLSLLASRAIIFVWLMSVMYTTKLLDGLDGLATGITGIGAAVIGALALFTQFYQPDVAVLAAILLGSCAGFLVFNFHPARIFLGEGGSTFVGFMLGVLAIISGGKIATAMLVLGIPVLDVAWVIFQRVRQGKSIFKGDRRHLHFQLLTAGFSHRGAVLFLYSLAALFGFSTLLLQSFGKLVALGGVVLVMGVLVLGIAWRTHTKEE